MTDIPLFDALALMNQHAVDWQDDAAHLELARLLMAIGSTLNEIIMKVNRLSRDQEDPLG